MIGIFDSGSGGLTVLKAIREAIPSADVVYFGDIKNAPYGSKSQDELSRLTVHVLEVVHAREVGNGKTTFLISQDSELFRNLVSNLFPDKKFSIEVV